MSERGVIFTGDSVRAIMAGTKTQTRRVIPAHPEGSFCRAPCIVGDTYLSPAKVGLALGADDFLEMARVDCPYLSWKRDDLLAPEKKNRLWVRETWRTCERPDDHTDGILFRADGAFVSIQNTSEAAEDWVVAHDNNKHRDAWRSPLYMPRWASRLSLRVTDVRVQRLQDLSEEDAIAELGLVDHPMWIDSPGEYFESKEYGLEGRSPVALYRIVWERIHGKKVPWESNPWLWAVTFEKVV